MKVFILINEWCNATESGYDIIEVFDNNPAAIDAMQTSYLDFIHQCDAGNVPNFEEYYVEDSIESSIIVRSHADNNLFEMFYVIGRDVLPSMTVTLNTKCRRCGKQFSITVDRKKFVNYMNSGQKELIQNVFPELTSNDRELFFISHICGECWNDIFDESEPNGYQEDDSFIEDMIELKAEEQSDSK